MVHIGGALHFHFVFGGSGMGAMLAVMTKYESPNTDRNPQEPTGKRSF